MLEGSKHMLIQKTNQRWRLKRQRKKKKTTPERFGLTFRTYSFKLKEKFKNQQHHQKLHTAKPKTGQTPQFPKFKLLFNLWLYMALQEETQLFYISHRHLLQSIIFLLCPLLCLSTTKDSESLHYAHLQRSVLCSRKIGPRKFREMQRQNITQLRKVSFAQVSRLKLALMCQKQISQHQTRVGLNAHRIKGEARHYSSYMTSL